MVAHHNPQTPGKDRALSEYYAHNVCSGFQMLRQGPWKYVYHTRFNDEFGPERELYNLEADPNEFQNLAASEPEKVSAMHEALTEELGLTPDEVEAQCRADYMAVAGEDWCQTQLSRFMDGPIKLGCQEQQKGSDDSHYIAGLCPKLANDHAGSTRLTRSTLNQIFRTPAHP